MAAGLFEAVCVCALAQPTFLTGVSGGPIQSASINEASGLACSRRNPGVIWTHNDSGDSARIFAFTATGAAIGTFTIGGASAVDWEDMALAPDPVSGVHYLYLGDIGDNAAVRTTIQVYRVPEPAVSAASSGLSSNLAGAVRYTFKFEDGARDAETLLVEPLTGDLYIISKRQTPARIYRCAYPQDPGITNVLLYTGSLTYGWPVGGDISPSGLQIVIREYAAMHYYARSPGDSVTAALTNTGVATPYMLEPQGEAVAWHGLERGYFTLSEGPAQPVYFYASSDTDGDGLSDAQEVAAGTMVAGADSDGDGQSDGEEWIAGTDAANPAAFFAASIVPSNNTYVMTWPALTARTYHVHSVYNVTNMYTLETIASNLAVSANQVTSLYFNVDGEQRAFFLGVERNDLW